MPIWVSRKTSVNAQPQAFDAEEVPVFVPEMVGRNCRLQDYARQDIPSVRVQGEIIAYASPDSTYAATKRLFDKATTSILIGIYDFSASHMRELLLAAMARGVRVSLMLDIDSEDESRVFDDLVQMGVTGVPAPSCANDVEHLRFFSSSHEKVIVIDDEWTLVQSGNYSDNSIPLNATDGGDPASFRTGNRDTGLAIRSRKLAELFTGILTRDMELVAATPQMLRELREDVFLIEKAPTKRPAKLFASKRFRITKPLTLRPVVSPDNYMDVIPGLLRKAKKSILIEQQYIRAKQDDIRTLLTAMKEARDRAPDLDIRIVLGKVFKRSALKAENENLDLLKDDFGLKLGTNIRYVNTERLVHCHNKMVVVDGESVLISSQNWSNSAVSKNREAGIWVKHAGLARYFGAIFETDWKSGYKTPEKGLVPDEAITPQALGAGGFVRVARADYEEV